MKIDVVKKKRKFLPTYCTACHRKVEYAYESNGYFCPEHGRLVFLRQGIPQSLIDTWWDRIMSKIDYRTRECDLPICLLDRKPPIECHYQTTCLTGKEIARLTRET